MDVSVLNGGEDDKVYSQKAEDMRVLWRVKPASNLPMNPVEMEGNPGRPVMEAGLYDVHVEVAMDGLVGTRDFQLRVNRSGGGGKECLDIDKSFSINGNSEVVLQNGKASSEYTVVDINRSLQNYRLMDETRLNCYNIVDVQWELGLNKRKEQRIGDGNPITIDFNQGGLYTAFASVEISFPGLRRANQIIEIEKDILVSGKEMCIERMFNDQPRIMINSLSYRVGSSVDLKLHLPDCWEFKMGEVESIYWEVDGLNIDTKGADYDISVTAQRPGTIPVKATVRYKNKRAVSIVESSFVIQGQTCAPCTPGKDYQCLDVICDPSPEVQ